MKFDMRSDYPCVPSADRLGDGATAERPSERGQAGTGRLGASTSEAPRVVSGRAGRRRGSPAIPKIIHVCWFGGGTPSPKIAACLASIDRLKRQGYDVRLWTEDNYDLTKSPRLITARENKRWSLVSNYARLDLLARYGGIYLDSDIQVIKDFDDLLHNEFFIGFIWDCTLGTAVIGAAPQHPIVTGILALYDADPSKFISPNNNTFTDYFLTRCPGFRLNGFDQSFRGVSVLNKYAFEHPTLFNRYNYTVHHFAQSWIRSSRLKNVAKSIVIKSMSLWLYRKYICWKSLHKSPYYNEYLRQIDAERP